MINNNLNSGINSSPLEALRCEQSSLIERVKKAAGELTDKSRLNSASGLALADLKKSDTVSRECEMLKPLIDEVDKHLKKLEELSADPGTVEDYLWICDTAIGWEHRLSELLNISRTVSLANAPTNLLPPLDPGAALSEGELDFRVKSLAKVVLAYCKKKREASGSQQELNRHRAEVFLANDILDGTIDFARRISSRSYGRLEKIWMAEVRELLAYLDWESSGAVLFDPNTERHYIKAWDDFKERIRSPQHNKMSPSEFGEVKRYLEDRYVKFNKGHYQLDYKKLQRDGENSIVKIKSRKVSEEAGKWNPDRYWDDKQNWHDAEYYVKNYYEHIIPAVMEGDEECANVAIQAFDYSMKGPYRIINSFEMAIVIYFLSTETLSKVQFP